MYVQKKQKPWLNTEKYLNAVQCQHLCCYPRSLCGLKPLPLFWVYPLSWERFWTWSGVSDMLLHSKLPRCWPEDLVGIPQGWKGVPASSIRMHFIQFKWDPFLSQLTLTNPASLFFLILRCLNLWLEENGSNPILTDLRGCSNSLIVLHIAYFGCLPKGSRAWKTSGSTDLGRQFNVICWL